MEKMMMAAWRRVSIRLKVIGSELRGLPLRRRKRTNQGGAVWALRGIRGGQVRVHPRGGDHLLSVKLQQLRWDLALGRRLALSLRRPLTDAVVISM